MGPAGLAVGQASAAAVVQAMQAAAVMLRAVPEAEAAMDPVEVVAVVVEAEAEVAATAALPPELLRMVLRDHRVEAHLAEEVGAVRRATARAVEAAWHEAGALLEAAEAANTVLEGVARSQRASTAMTTAPTMRVTEGRRSTAERTLTMGEGVSGSRVTTTVVSVLPHSSSMLDLAINCFPSASASSDTAASAVSQPA